MTDVTDFPTVYVRGSLVIERETDSRFVLKGNYMLGGTHTADHFQLIYEALEIAANSKDKFAPTFRAMCDELMDLTRTWDE